MPTPPVYPVQDSECQVNWEWLRQLLPSTGDYKAGAYETPDDGWLLCDGRAISRVEYSNLFRKIGTAHGAGDGSTTFNLPDFRGRGFVGAGDGDASGHTNHVLGTKVGEQTHLLTSSESGVPAHTHPNSQDVLFNIAGGGAVGYAAGVATLNHGSVTISANTAANASSAHENRSPATVVNIFIKT